MSLSAWAGACVSITEQCRSFASYIMYYLVLLMKYNDFTHSISFKKIKEIVFFFFVNTKANKIQPMSISPVYGPIGICFRY